MLGLTIQSSFLHSLNALIDFNPYPDFPHKDKAYKITEALFRSNQWISLIRKETVPSVSSHILVLVTAMSASWFKFLVEMHDWAGS